MSLFKLGETPLHQAADNGLLKIAELLLENHANPNIQQNDGNTALHLAIIKGDMKLAKLLISYGSNPNIQNQTVYILQS